MAPGIQLILPGDFQEGAWPDEGNQCVILFNSPLNVRFSQVKIPVVNHVNQRSLWSAEAVSLLQRPVQNGVHPSLNQHPKARKTNNFLPFCIALQHRWTLPAVN
jgi:uncharacterized membrane protein